MTVVVDASVAGKWFVREAGRKQALEVLDTPERHAPDLIVAEIGNVAGKKRSGARSAASRRASSASP